MSMQNDNDRAFYLPPEGTNDPRSLGYSDPDPETQALFASRFLMRMTPGPMNLAKGTPIDFTIHVKALVDFLSASPLVLTLAPIVGNGSGEFAIPVPQALAGEPVISLNEGRISITAKSTDDAARIVLHTDYPADWWAGSSRCTVEASESLPSVGGPPSHGPVTRVEANVFVSDRVPAAWNRWADTRKGTERPHEQ